MFRNCLNQHWRRRRGGPPKISLNRNIIWRYHRNERALQRLPQGHGRGKLGNITMSIFLLIRLHFTIFTTRLSQHSDSERALLTIDFSFFQLLSIWRFWVIGLFRRIEVHQFLDNDGVWRGWVPEIPLGCMGSFRFPSYAFLLPQKHGFTFAFWWIHGPATL